jgi:hypothetical protein
MSGWQRIGVAISVLWILAVPSYFVISSNRAAGEYYRQCIPDAGIHGGTFNREDFEKDMQRCAATEREWAISPARIMQDLLFQGDSSEGQLLWGMILVPIVIFWIIGGIVFATLRWIGRGFSSVRK